MNKLERANLLRERLPIVRGYRLPPYKVLSKPVIRKPKPFINWRHLSVAQHLREIPLKWVQEPVGRRSTTVTVRNGAALARIAEKLRR